MMTWLEKYKKSDLVKKVNKKRKLPMKPKAMKQQNPKVKNPWPS